MITPTLEELRATFLFKECTEEQFAWLQANSEVVLFEAASCILSAEQAPEAFWVLLEGQLQFTRKIGGREMVTETSTDPGIWGGWLPAFDEMPKLQGYSIRTLQPSRVLQLEKPQVRELFARGFPVFSHLMAGVYGGIQNFESLARQQEKMAALGKLSAGLAHELNNPAAAVRRSVEQMREILIPQEERALLLGQKLSHEEISYLSAFRQRTIEQLNNIPVLDALRRSDLEDELQEWLDEYAVEEAWQVAPALLDVGLRVESLEELAQHLPAESIPPALDWLSATLSLVTLTHTIESSSQRISDLVKSIKAYTYMDQGSQQEVDLHEGLDDTLRILSYKLKKQSVTVERRYAPNLPRVMVYGSLLNQVWTNLIDNAIDALKAIPDYARHITISTNQDGKWLTVEVCDNGPGIPKDVQNRIFEPFFTTKPQGQGTGLGLDTSYRIIQQHRGDITVTSRSGNTAFLVRLPLK